uniref:Uncharacterized protein n=1 Tax=Rhizophora mucronata TaxID=61149 RepID=A0A2P2IH68_RHIMU
MSIQIQSQVSNDKWLMRARTGYHSSWMNLTKKWTLDQLPNRDIVFHSEARIL